MTRKAFLQAGAASLASALLPPLAASADDPPEKKRALKKAVNLGMVKADGASVADRFKMVRDAGFDGIELNRPDAIPLDDLIKASASAGLPVAGVIDSVHWSKPLSSPDAKIREQGFNGLKLALQEAGELGCERLLLVPAVVNKDVSYADAYTRCQALIKEAVPFAEKRAAVSPSRTSGINFCSARSKPRALSMRSAARGLAGISTSGTSSTSAGPSSGCASSARACSISTSRNTAAKSATPRACGKASTPNSAKAMSSGPP